MLATKNQKAVIHILKNEYKISDDDYKKMLWDKYEVFSSVDLTEVQATEFIHELNINHNEDYKRGFMYALDKFISDVNLEDNFKTLTKLVYDSEPTQLELKMFDNMNLEQKMIIIDSLKEKI